MSEGLSKTTPVQGGIKNAINHAHVALKQFFATIGDGINEAYSLDTAGTSINEKLQRMADAFRNLDPATKKSIVNFALFVAAVGPAVKIVQGFYGAASLAVTGIRIFRDMAKGMITSALNAAKAIGAMSTAMKFTVAGAVLAGVVALYLAFNTLSENINDAFHTTRALNEINKEATSNISKEKAGIDPLISILKDETATRENKIGALNKLKEIAPKYFSDLNTEKVNIDSLNKAYEGYIESLLKADRVKAAERQRPSNEALATRMRLGCRIRRGSRTRTPRVLRRPDRVFSRTQTRYGMPRGSGIRTVIAPSARAGCPGGNALCWWWAARGAIFRLHGRN